MIVLRYNRSLFLKQCTVLNKPVRILHCFLKEMSEKYGPITAVKIFRKFAVVLSSYEAVHQVFQKQGSDFSGRPSSVMYETLTDNSGEAFSE